MILYVITIITSAPFLVSWGGKKSSFAYVIDFLTAFPVDWNYLMVNKSFGFVFLNGFFWGVIFYIAFVWVKKMLNKIHSQK